VATEYIGMRGIERADVGPLEKFEIPAEPRGTVQSITE
jgi:hypothetical protein